MSIIRSIVNMFSGNAQEDNKPIDTDRHGSKLFKEDIIRYVKDELERRRTERLPLENQWRLNSNFLSGNQYCDINTHIGEIEQILPIHDWLERETFNRIAPLIETRIANLKKINYSMTSKPATNELDDYSKAEVSTAIQRHKQENSDFDSKKNTMVLWNELCGNCFWLSWWDKNAGDEYARKPATEFEEEQIYKEGDVDYGLLTPYELFPESVFKQGIENQRSIIIERVKSVDDIYDEFGIEVDGSSIDTFALTPLPVTGGYGWEGTVNTLGSRTIDNSQKVITYLEHKSRTYPDGRLIIIVGDDNLVYYGPLPYGTFPIRQVVCKEVAGMFYGKSVIEELIPLQRAYNGCVNRIHEYIKRIVLQGRYAEEGSIVDLEDYEENGGAPDATIYYRQGSQAPSPIPNADLPPEIMAEREQLKQDMEYVAAVSQLMVIGQAPSGVTSGTAIESLRDIDNTRLSLTGDHIRNSIKGLAKDWLSIYKKYALKETIQKIVGDNKIADVNEWMASDITQYDLEYDTINELELSKDLQKQNLVDLINIGAFTDADGRLPQNIKQQLIDFHGFGGKQETMDLNELQYQRADRENNNFEKGVIPEISPIDNHQVHLEQHERYMLQFRFEIIKTKKPEYARTLLDHYLQHKQAVAQEQQQAALAQMGGLPQ